jgi:ceroid-lipofuscinosis MFS transporter 7
MAARQLGLLFGPALNFGTEHLHFPLGPFEVTSLTVPGLVMVVCWAATGLSVYFMFTDIDAPLTSAPGTRVVSRQPSRQPSYNNLTKLQGEKAPLLAATKVHLPTKQARLSVAHEAINEHDDEVHPVRQDSSEDELVYTIVLTRWEEYTQLPVLALFGVSFLCIFNQLALETWVTPFTQEYFGWQETANS